MRTNGIRPITNSFFDSICISSVQMVAAGMLNMRCRGERNTLKNDER